MIKIERTSTAPASLAHEATLENGSYNREDVVTQLREDFHNKCYICEIQPVQDPEVEHLFPHKGRSIKERVFDWNNLFFSCGHCNGMKNQSKYDNGILDCCKVDPEKYIKFSYIDGGVEISKIESYPLVDLTVELLDEVYNKKNTGIRTSACQTRVDELSREMNILYKSLQRYQLNPQDAFALRGIRVSLRRESAFAAFKRCYVRENLDRYPELEEFVVL